MKDKLKFPTQDAPIPPGAIDLSQIDKVKNPLAIVLHEDLVDQGPIAEGTTNFFVSAKDGEWGTFSKDRDILAVTILAAKDAEGTEWAPLVGARVVVRFKTDKPEGFVVLDGSTRGDGTTILLPGRVFPIDTPLGRLLHCPIQKGVQCRTEVTAPGYAGATVRCILHTLRADKA